MTITTAFTRGFTVAAKTPKMVLLVYFFNFALSAFVALAFVDGMQNAAGNSMILQSLLEKFRGGNVTDFLNNDGSVLKAYLSQVKWVLLMYWIATIFLSGGIIKTLNKEKFNVGTFFGATGYYFWRYLGLAVLMLVVHIIVLAIFIIPTSIILEAQWPQMSSERDLIYIIMGVAAGYLAVLGVIFMIADYAKFYLMLYDSVNVFKAYWKASGFVMRRLFRVYALYLMIMLISFIFVYLFIKLNEDIAMHTTAAIWLTFLVQQLFVFIRTWFRIWLYSSELELFAANYILDSKEAFAKEYFNDMEQKIVANSIAEKSAKTNEQTTTAAAETKTESKTETQQTTTKAETQTTAQTEEKTVKTVTTEHTKYMPQVTTEEALVEELKQTEVKTEVKQTEVKQVEVKQIDLNKTEVNQTDVKQTEASKTEVKQDAVVVENTTTTETATDEMMQKMYEQENSTTSVPDVDYDVYNDYDDGDPRG